jgi:hypothetical protein
LPYFSLKVASNHTLFPILKICAIKESSVLLRGKTNDRKLRAVTEAFRRTLGLAHFALCPALSLRNKVFLLQAVGRTG